MQENSSILPENCELKLQERLAEKEHETLDVLMMEIGALAKDISANQMLSSDAQTLLLKLNQLEIDMEIHAHKEDHVLFPKALE